MIPTSSSPEHIKKFAMENNVIDVSMVNDTRNVADWYRYWKTEAIKAELDTRRFNFSVLCQNIQGDFNLSSIVRSSNAFLAKEVIIYGNKRFDRRGTVGTGNYTNFKHVRRLDNIDALFSEYDVVVGIDNVPGSSDISEMEWDPTKKTLICFGEESVGLTGELLDRCSKTLYIKQFGSVRSLNVGCVAGIVMYDYTSKIQKLTNLKTA